MAEESSVGFIGLGTMGEAMALRLARAGRKLVVWNRTEAKTRRLVEAGAELAADVPEVFVRAARVILMLADIAAIDAVLGRGTPVFASRVQGRMLINMATIATRDSKALSEAVTAAGGRYIEAPVSGSRTPAENGQLVAMVAGPPGAADSVRTLLAPMCREIVDCGAVPAALAMKLSVNVVLIAYVTALAEAVHFADRHGLNPSLLKDVLFAGPMASEVMRIKLPKLMERDFSTQAAIRNVYDNCRLIVEAADEAGAATPLLAQCLELYRETLASGRGELDMAAVLHAIEQRR